MIRTSKHTIKFSNTGKLKRYKSFLVEYRRVIQLYIDYLWINSYSYKNRTLDIKNEKYECPSNLLASVTESMNFSTPLSARSLKCCSTQACGMIKAALEVPRKRQFILNKLKNQGKDTTILEKAIREQQIIKPSGARALPELNSICCDFLDTSKDSEFDGFIQLKSLGKEYGKILIPIKFHRQSNKWKNKGSSLMKSFLFSGKNINFRWESEDPALKSTGEIKGADQGLKDILALSDGTRTPKKDKQGHSLESITEKLARKRKGSKAFKAAQEHRKNFINWSINQLNFDDIRELKLEKIINIRYKKKSSRYMSHWRNTLIRDKILKNCQELGVRVTEQFSFYRSQRCQCGWVQKRNRVGKLFKCRNCGYTEDSDVNAAMNHLIDLPEIPSFLIKQRLNLKGFFWNPDGFKNDAGEDLTVPLSQKST